MKKILIIPPNKLPIPTVLGGAAETLIYAGLMKPNEKKDGDVHFTVLSIENEEAKKKAKEFKNTDVVFYKHSNGSRIMDSILTFFLKIFRKKNLISLSYSFRTLSFIHIIKKYLKKNDFDEVVIENTLPALRAFKSKKVFNKYKGHYWYHAHSPFKRDYGAKEAFENLSGVIGVSQYICDLYSNIPDHKKVPTHLLQNFGDTDIFYPSDPKSELKKRFSISEGDHITLFVGRLDETKGVDKLIEAFKGVVEHDPKSKLLIVGSNFFKSDLISPYERLLRELAQPIKNNVIFTGYIDHHKMGEIYALADIVCLPSVWQEPGALTIFESMCCGKALITTKSGGIPEYVGEAGIVLPVDDNLVDNIASNIIKLEENPKMRKELEKAAHERSLLYSKEKYYQDFLDIVLGPKTK